MDAFIIEGGRRLSGRLRVNGSKNSALPILAAALLTDQPVNLLSVPRLADIANMRKLLAELGCDVEEAGEGGALRLKVRDESASSARYDIVRTMRASICVLGPLLARRGLARVSMPGGCAIGDRPVDIHLRGLAALGAEISLESGDIVARAPKGGRLKGTRIFLGGPFGPTVLGTANVMSAAALAHGTTVIESAACEPEVADLADLLNKMGAHIRGAGTPRIVIEGVKELHGATHEVIPDRIEAGTYMCAAAITNGQVILDNCPVDALMAAQDRLEHVGVHFRLLENPPRDAMRASVEITCDRNLRPIEVTTQPHPGFPTDLQAQLMAMLCLADGNSVVTERIYPQRFLHVPELARMGAQLFHQGPTVVVSGVKQLVGAPVMASDLRASASLIIAGLAAKGRTTVRRVYHLDRGYERMEDRLNALGASIERIDEKELTAMPE
ncbi:MAG TPA: UDP-N-acetylglucosamine 1-carboxyvinyltransferase [Phycisphaerales bacterium]|nr:UDP-N-acetylglucosamine 1-carboxyvinyltransferase [Phycisphaerales bacterium]